jgi:hypothetical protein
MFDLIKGKNEINQLHEKIEQSLSNAVSYAINIGEILSNVKEIQGHGNFMNWVSDNCKFSHKTANNYYNLWKYKDSLQNRNALTNLQEAYKQVETLEAQAKQSESQKAAQRVAEYKKTGVKPEGWRRGTDDNLYNEEIARDERIKKYFEQSKLEEERKQKEKAERQKKLDDIDEMIGKMGGFDYSQAINNVMESAKKKQEFKERIRISHEGQNDQFIDALMDYLNELADDSRRIEACYNIIKVCKGIANDLQVGK